jgi:hypothetical protein
VTLSDFSSILYGGGLPAFVRVALFKYGEVAPLQKFRHGKAGNPAALEVGTSRADIWNRYVGRRGAGLSVVPADTSLDGTEKLRKGYLFPVYATGFRTTRTVSYLTENNTLSEKLSTPCS